MAKKFPNRYRKGKYVRLAHLRTTKPGPVANRVKEGEDMDDDDLEVLRAVDIFKREQRKNWPGITDVIDIMRGLGWEKVGLGQLNSLT